MTTVTLTSQGQLTLPRTLRDALGLAPGARLQASIDRQGRIVLVPSKYEPEELFLHRPKADRCLSLEQMEQAIAAAVGKSEDRKDA
jgi:AbrB family looped-hinge helix DNA binding protein